MHAPYQMINISYSNNDPKKEIICISIIPYSNTDPKSTTLTMKVLLFLHVKDFDQV